MWVMPSSERHVVDTYAPRVNAPRDCHTWMSHIWMTLMGASNVSDTYVGYMRMSHVTVVCEYVTWHMNDGTTRNTYRWHVMSETSHVTIKRVMWRVNDATKRKKLGGKGNVCNNGGRTGNVSKRKWVSCKVDRNTETVILFFFAPLVVETQELFAKAYFTHQPTHAYFPLFMGP